MKFCLWNGEILPKERVHIDPEDRGYQFGDGVYEVIRIYNGKPFAEAAHFERLLKSLQALRIPFPFPLPDISTKLAELLRREVIMDGIIYLQVTRGTAPRAHAFPTEGKANLIAYASPYPRPLKSIEEGGEAILMEDIRWLRCDIKSLNLLGSVLAKEEAKEKGALEAILHRGDTVTEGSSSNVFIVKKDILYTHPTNHLILNGITRQVVLQIAERLHIPVREEAFSVGDLSTADELMITSTINEITPIIRIGEQSIGNGKPGEITRRLQGAFEREIGLLKA